MPVLQTAGQIAVHQAAAKGFNKVRRGVGKVLKKEKTIKLNNSQKKSIRSLKKQAAIHRQKLKNYIANPDKYDNRSILKNADTPELREKIIQTRISNLKHQIHTFEKDVDAIKSGLK